MKYFFLETTKENLQKFEEYRNMVLRKKNNDELKTIFSTMIKEIKDFDMQSISEELRYFLQFSKIDWRMEIEIALKILEIEVQSIRLTYSFELTNYIFYFMCLPDNFKNTFFSMHGIPIDINEIEKYFSNELPKEQYYIFKKGQELYRSYLDFRNELEANFIDILNKVKADLKVSSLQKNNYESVYILQVNS